MNVSRITHEIFILLSINGFSISFYTYFLKFIYIYIFQMISNISKELLQWFFIQYNILHASECKFTWAAGSIYFKEAWYWFMAGFSQFSVWGGGVWFVDKLCGLGNLYSSLKTLSYIKKLNSFVKKNFHKNFKGIVQIRGGEVLIHLRKPGV